MSEPRVAVYSGNKAVYQDMVTSAKSLLDHDGADRIYFLTDEPEFPEPLPDMIEHMDISSQTWFQPNGPNYHSSRDLMVLIRLAYPMIFREYERILTIDVDTIVKGSLDDIWNLNLGDAWLAAVNERLFKANFKPYRSYFNNGVALYNLKKLGTIAEDMIRSANAEARDLSEQDILNDFCVCNIIGLPDRFNYAFPHFDQPKDLPNVAIRHYASESFNSYREKVDYNTYLSKTWDEVLNK